MHLRKVKPGDVHTPFLGDWKLRIVVMAFRVKLDLEGSLGGIEQSDVVALTLHSSQEFLGDLSLIQITLLIGIDPFFGTVKHVIDLEEGQGLRFGAGRFLEGHLASARLKFIFLNTVPARSRVWLVRVAKLDTSMVVWPVRPATQIILNLKEIA